MVSPAGSPSKTGRILMYGTAFCSDCRVAKRIFAEQDTEYDFIDIDQVPGAADEVLRLNDGKRSIPTIIFPDGAVLVEPSRRELMTRI